MKQSAFNRLYEVVGNSDRLLVAYDNVLSDLFKNTFWQEGPTELRRVLWNQGRRAQVEDSETFESPGLYLWGSKDIPLYIGITRGSFSKRFVRYIWSERSQCNLAQQFEAALRSMGIDGFPPEIRDWYARNFGGSTVRLEGAVQFAKAGIAEIWFALFPHATVAEIRVLEQALIPVAEKWNENRGLGKLLNKQR
ncbi:MAG TPA: hypothetical protein VGR97_09715 [Candidatus Acidoferrales bacterium]|nr:hypothetical protein [Candidatus Acidoferrales bacterium]